MTSKLLHSQLQKRINSLEKSTIKIGKCPNLYKKLFKTYIYIHTPPKNYHFDPPKKNDGNFQVRIFGFGIQESIFTTRFVGRNILKMGWVGVKARSMKPGQSMTQVLPKTRGWTKWIMKVYCCRVWAGPKKSYSSKQKCSSYLQAECHLKKKKANVFPLLFTSFLFRANPSFSPHEFMMSWRGPLSLPTSKTSANNINL